MKKIIIILYSLLPIVTFAYQVEEQESFQKEAPIECRYEVPFQVKQDGNIDLKFWITKQNALRENFLVGSDKMCIFDESKALVVCETLKKEDEGYYFLSSIEGLKENISYYLCSDFIDYDNIQLKTDKLEYNRGDTIVVESKKPIKRISGDIISDSHVFKINGSYIQTQSGYINTSIIADKIGENQVKIIYPFSVNGIKYERFFRSNIYTIQQIDTVAKKDEDLILNAEIKDGLLIIDSRNTNITNISIADSGNNKNYIQNVSTQFPVQLELDYLYHSLYKRKKLDEYNVTLTLKPLVNDLYGNTVLFGNEIQIKASFGSDIWNRLYNSKPIGYEGGKKGSIKDITLEILEKQKANGRDVDALIEEVKNDKTIYEDEEEAVDMSYFIETYGKNINIDDVDDEDIEQVKKEFAEKFESKSSYLVYILIIFGTSVGLGGIIFILLRKRKKNVNITN